MIKIHQYASFSFLLFLFSVCVSTMVFASDYKTAKSDNTLYNASEPNQEKKPEAQDSSEPAKENENSAVAQGKQTALDTSDKAYIEKMAAQCVTHWENKECLKTLSEISLIVTSNYADALSKAGQEKLHGPLKEKCAASTAATRVEVPAYALQSALAECLNAISDFNEVTGVKPEPTKYQLLVSGVLCLSENPSCGYIEKTIKGN